MIRFDQVSMRYPNGYEALKQVSFILNAGDMAFLVGHSGAGKSTLLKLVNRVEIATRGQVWVSERNLNKLAKWSVPSLRRDIGVVWQDHKLLYDRNVYENVALPLIVAGISARETGRRVRAALDKVGLLEKERLNPITLSGGEQQRVGIARAVVNKPKIVLADEPTGNLDLTRADEIMDLFVQFNLVGVCVLIATHDIRHIQRLNKPVLHLDQGRLITDGQHP